MDKPAPDFRFCPHCGRRLLALGSPACNYCGLALPGDFVEARADVLRRIREASESGDAGALDALENEGDEALRRALRSLFDLDEKTRRD